MQALCSRTNPAGWGDVLAATGLLALSGTVRWRTLPALLVAVACALAVSVSVAVAAHSLCPPALFGGGIRFVLFTLLPAGSRAYLPVEIVRDPSAQTLALAVAGAALYTAFALWLFARGLRRYASGNRFTRG